MLLDRYHGVWGGDVAEVYDEMSFYHRLTELEGSTADVAWREDPGS